MRLNINSKIKSHIDISTFCPETVFFKCSKQSWTPDWQRPCLVSCRRDRYLFTTQLRREEVGTCLWTCALNLYAFHQHADCGQWCGAVEKWMCIKLERADDSAISLVMEMDLFCKIALPSGVHVFIQMHSE